MEARQWHPDPRVAGAQKALKVGFKISVAVGLELPGLCRLCLLSCSIGKMLASSSQAFGQHLLCQVKSIGHMGWQILELLEALGICATLLNIELRS